MCSCLIASRLLHRQMKFWQTSLWNLSWELPCKRKILSSKYQTNMSPKKQKRRQSKERSMITACFILSLLNRSLFITSTHARTLLIICNNWFYSLRRSHKWYPSLKTMKRTKKVSRMRTSNYRSLYQSMTSSSSQSTYARLFSGCFPISSLKARAASPKRPRNFKRFFGKKYSLLTQKALLFSKKSSELKPHILIMMIPLQEETAGTLIIRDIYSAE